MVYWGRSLYINVRNGVQTVTEQIRLQLCMWPWPHCGETMALWGLIKAWHYQMICVLHKKNKSYSVVWLRLKHPALWLIIFIHRFSFICVRLLFFPGTICCIVWMEYPNERRCCGYQNQCKSVSMGRVYQLALLHCQWVELCEMLWRHRLHCLRMAGGIEQQRGKMKYLNQVPMWIADEDLAASQPFISTAFLKFKHDAQIPVVKII